MIINAKLSLIDLIDKILDDDEDFIDETIDFDNFGIDDEDFIHESIDFDNFGVDDFVKYIRHWDVMFDSEKCSLDVYFYKRFKKHRSKKEFVDRFGKFLCCMINQSGQIDEKIFSLYGDCNVYIGLTRDGTVTLRFYHKYGNKGDELDIDYQIITDKIKKFRDFWGDKVYIYTILEIYT